MTKKNDPLFAIRRILEISTCGTSVAVIPADQLREIKFLLDAASKKQAEADAAITEARPLPSRLVPVIVPTVNAETGETAVTLSDLGPVLEVLKDVTARIGLDARNADSRPRYLVVETAGCGCGTCQEIRRQQGRDPLETVEPARCTICDGTFSLASICEICAERYL